MRRDVSDDRRVAHTPCRPAPLHTSDARHTDSRQRHPGHPSRQLLDQAFRPLRVAHQVTRQTVGPRNRPWDVWLRTNRIHRADKNCGAQQPTSRTRGDPSRRRACCVARPLAAPCLAADEVLDALEVAQRLDVMQARARLAIDLQATRPVVQQEGVVKLLQARHPILCLRDIDVVAQDLNLDRDHPALVISGPNAGARRSPSRPLAPVLLIHHGCFVPAMEGSRVDYSSRPRCLAINKP